MQADIDNEQLTISLLFPTNSLRTYLQKSAESSQKVSPYNYLPNNQHSFFNTQHGESDVYDGTGGIFVRHFRQFRHFRHLLFS